MIARLIPSILILMFTVSHFSQQPPIEAGVPQALAEWRAARYSDVRYKLNLTLEKMSPVLKGTIEIRVNVRDAGDAKSSPPYARSEVAAALGGRGGSLIVLDWRKIRGSESLSTVSNVSINGLAAVVSSVGENHPVAEAATPLLRKEGSQEGPPEGGTQNSYEESNEHLTFRQGVKAGENVIKLDFTSPILASGSAITRYVDKEDGSEYLYSLFVPSDASTAFPVFDQPDLKARFSLQVTAPNDWKLISNSNVSAYVQPNCGQASKINIETGEMSGVLPNKGCDPITSFAETKPISTYVFAFAAGPWVEFDEAGGAGGNLSGSEGDLNAERGTRNSESDPKSKIQNRRSTGTLPTGRVSASDAGLSSHIYVRRSQAEKFKAHAAEVFRLNREGVKFLEEYFDYKFPFPKYDIVLIPEFPFGGMEHAGATFLREASIIFPSEPTANDYISRAGVIFHEAAHQWFGDTVTMRWFDDLWLKEGFAEFMAYKTLERVMPQYNAWKAFYERNKPAAYATDSTRGTTPIYQEIPNLSAAKSAYGNIVYRKAPSFLRQAEFYLGPDKFQTAVRAFLKKHEFGNAGWEDLVKEFETASGQNLKEWAKAWVTRRGMPVVRLSRYQGTGFCLNQTNSLGEPSGWPVKFLVLKAFSEDDRVAKDVELDPSLVNPKQAPTLPNRKSSEVRMESCQQTNHEPSNLSFLFPNYQDYGYGIFLLDDKSREYVLKNIQNEKDDFLRSMMWGTLWDSVREGELDPREYVELAIRVLSPGFSRPSAGGGPPEGGTHNAPVETDELTIQTILGRVSTAMTYYIPGGQGVSVPPAVAGGAVAPSASNANGLNARLENLLIDNMRTAPTLGQKVTYYRAFLNIASTENARKVLKEMLRGSGTPAGSTTPAAKDAATPPIQERNAKRPPEGGTHNAGPVIPLKTKDRFDIVTKLAILGDPDAPALLAALEKTETSDDAKRYAYAAHAAFPTKENREKFWNDFVNNKDISESWIEAAMGTFNSPRHSELSLPYLQRALAELPNLKRNRKIFFVNGWLAAFIGGQKSQEALDIVNKFLADNPGLDRDLRLKVLENVDVVERAVKIRKRFESRL